MKSLLQQLGPVTAIIGAQWGDEGKGKVTDLLAEHFDVIARACGGANAGHTIVVNGKKHVFHLLPAGSLHAGKAVVLGSGMVIHLPTLLEEIATLKETGIDIIGRLFISPAAHIVFEFHKQIDTVMEERRSKGIGTTRRGIGPAYMDKAARTGIRMERLTEDLRAELTARSKELKKMYDITVDIDAELKSLKDAREILRPAVVKSLPILMHDFLERKQRILIEGAQAILLDIDHGTYPYVTSSSTSAAGALQGLGLPPSMLHSCIGVAKAYCTRVGAGEFPTEEIGAHGDRLRKRGGEYGATTGRPRRCGWLDLEDIRFSTVVNGFTHINLTKLDVLDEEAEIRFGVGREADGSVKLERIPGWKTSTAGLTSFEKLPKQAQTYIERIEEFVKIPVALIGTGPGREDIIVR